MASTATVKVVGDADGEWAKALKARAATLSRWRRVRGMGAVTLKIEAAGSSSAAVTLVSRGADADSALAQCLESVRLVIDEGKKAKPPAKETKAKAPAVKAPVAKAPAPAPAPPVSDLSVLDLSVPKLEKALASGKYDKDLVALLQAEEDGKTRKTAVEAIKARMA